MAGMARTMGATLAGAQKLQLVTCSFFNLYFSPHTTINCTAAPTQCPYLMYLVGRVAPASPSNMTKL